MEIKKNNNFKRIYLNSALNIFDGSAIRGCLAMMFKVYSIKINKIIFNLELKSNSQTFMLAKAVSMIK